MINEGINEIYPMLLKKSTKNKDFINDIQLHILLKEKRKIEIDAKIQDIRDTVREIDQIQSIEYKKKSKLI